MVAFIGKDAQNFVGVDYVATWRGIYELIADMEKPQVGPSNARINRSSVEKFKKKVYNPEAGARAAELADEFRERVPELKRLEKRPTKVWSDEDGELSIERYLNEEDKCWRKTLRPKRPNKSIRLMSEISATGYSTDDELFTRCSTIIALASWLEEAGYNVEILASDYSLNFNGFNTTELGTVVVKEASESLDPANLAGIICNQEFGYNILLKAIVHVCPTRVKHSWGTVQPIPADVLDALDIDVSAPRTIIDPETSAKWLSDAVNAIEAGEKVRNNVNKIYDWLEL